MNPLRQFPNRRSAGSAHDSAFRLLACSLLTILAFGSASRAEENKGSYQVEVRTEAADRESPSTALSSLQKAQARNAGFFVLQRELDSLIREGGGGACASAAGIDLLQALRVMAGLEPLENPYEVVRSSFADQPVLLNGLVLNEEFVHLILFYEAHLNGAKVAIDVASAPNSEYAKGGPTWSAAKGPDLRVEPRQIKVLAYTITANGKRIGRHFVLLKESKADGITVVDPQGPTEDRHFQIDYRQGKGGDRERAFLLPPKKFEVPGRVFELNTIFKVSLATGDGSQTAGKSSIEDIKAGIDRTANEFYGTKDFLSPRAWRKKTASFGLPGLDLPVEHGGSNWPATEMVNIFRHAGRHNLNFRDIVGGAHVRPLLKSSSPEVRRIVRQVASGNGYVAIAITEPEAGTDVRNIRSAAQKVKGGYRLSGQKRYNARLEQATHVIIFTQSANGRHGDLSAFVLPIDTPGLERETLEAHGLAGNSYGGLRFKDLFVSDDQLIGEDGKGSDIFDEHFLYWRLMQAAAAIGTGEKALEMTADRLKTRHVHGGPIGRFTHLQQPLGQHMTELRMAYALAVEAAEMIDRGEYQKARGIVCGIKAEGVEIAINAVDAAMRAYGGEGYSTRVDLGERLRDLHGLRIADGTTDVMRMEVVRQAFGREFWDMAIKNTVRDSSNDPAGTDVDAQGAEAREGVKLDFRHFEASRRGSE